MRKSNFALLSTCILTGLFAFKASSPIEKIRHYYELAPNNETALDSLLNICNQNGSVAEIKGYFYAGQCIQAKFAKNPWQKYTLCKNALSNLNRLVNNFEQNVEIRYIRFSVEVNLPAYLPFENHIEADKNFILINLNTNHSNYHRIKKFIIKEGKLTETEKKQIDQ